MKSKVIGELRAKSAQKAEPVTLSLSLGEGKEPVDRIAKRLLRQSKVELVHVHPLARVVSVRGTPAALLPIVESSHVQDAIRSDEPDVLPQPMNRRLVDIDKEGFKPVQRNRHR
jgi:hypothetical protein